MNPASAVSVRVPRITIEAPSSRSRPALSVRSTLGRRLAIPASTEMSREASIRTSAKEVEIAEASTTRSSPANWSTRMSPEKA